MYQKYQNLKDILDSLQILRDDATAKLRHSNFLPGANQNLQDSSQQQAPGHPQP